MNLTESHGVFVRIRAGLDVVSSQAIWEFQTVDPVTGKHCMGSARAMCTGCLYSVEWNGGMEWWNGTVEWNSGMEWWNSGMTTPIDRVL